MIERTFRARTMRSTQTPHDPAMRAGARRRPWPVAYAVLGGWLALWGVSAFAAPPPDKIALTNARIIPIVGAEIERGVVLVENGKIAAVGAKVEIPYDARVFDCAGKVVMPGTINVHTQRGLDQPNESRPVVPQLDVYDALDPANLFFEDCLRIGTTVVNVMPGNNTVIGGLGRVVRPIGLSVDEMTIAADAFLKLSVSPRNDSERMQQLATLREAFLELSEYENQLAEKRYEDKLKEEKKDVDVGPAEAKKRGKDMVRAEDVDDQHRNLLRLRGGVLRVLGAEGPALFKPLGAFIWCSNAMDVGAALRIAHEYEFSDRVVLVLGGEAHKALDELKQAARPIVLPSELLYREIDPLTGEISETELARKFFGAGLFVALSALVDDSLSERMLTYQAAVAIRQGASRDEALRAITLNPAIMLGLDARLGSLEVGKDAHLVVWSGDPLDFRSTVERVFINGIPAYDRKDDVRLKRLLSVSKEGDDAPAATTAPAGKPASTTGPAEAGPQTRPAGDRPGAGGERRRPPREPGRPATQPSEPAPGAGGKDGE